MQQVRRRALLRIALLMHIPALIAACGGTASPTTAPAQPTQAPAKPTVGPDPKGVPPPSVQTFSAVVSSPTAAASPASAPTGNTVVSSPVETASPNNATTAVTKPVGGASSTPAASVAASTAVAPAVPPAASPGGQGVAGTPVGSPGTTVPAAQAVQVPIPSCVLTPAMTDGPYFVDEKLNRSDIRADPSNGTVKPGALLTMTMRVLGVSGTACAPVPGAQVDVWQCDALGVYSDVIDRTFNTKGQKFLRGHQISDAGGNVTFQTVYPGWYPGRATHIHFKVRTNVASGRGKELSSQVFIDDALNTQVYTGVAPYSTRGNSGRTTNAQDGIFRDGGSQLLLKITKIGDAYAATIDLGLKLT